MSDCGHGSEGQTGKSREMSDADVRCVCGRLILRRTPIGIEVRCCRCKRQLRFTWEGEPQRT